MMRKVVPEAVRSVRQKILKQMKQLKFRIEKNEKRHQLEKDTKLEEVVKKIRGKLSAKLKQIENLKSVEKDKDFISKLALRHDLKYFRKMILQVSATILT